jgi:hypothetical protein
MPRRLKPEGMRQRRNKASTRATLKAGLVRAPALPTRACSCGGPIEQARPSGKRKRGRPRKPPATCSICQGTGILPWHHLSKAWWTRLWASPMASQFIESDVDALYELAALKDAFWHGGADGKLAGEIRQRAAQFGSTPLDRRRLEWGLEHPDEESDEAPPTPEPQKPRDDPRNVLRMVKPA